MLKKLYNVPNIFLNQNKKAKKWENFISEKKEVW